MKQLSILFEEYFQSEGWTFLFSKERRSKLFWFPFLKSWVAGASIIWVPALATRGHYFEIFGGVFITVVSFWTVCNADVFSRRHKNFDCKKYFRGQERMPPDVTRAFFIYVPTIGAVLMGVGTHDIMVFILYIVFVYIFLFVLIFLERFWHEFRLAQLLVWLSTKTAITATTVSVFLTPTLLIFVLLSIFSQELWNTIGNIEWPSLAIFSFLILVPSIAITDSLLKKHTRMSVQSLPQTDDLVNMLEKSQFFRDKRQQGFISDEDFAWLREDLSWRERHKKGINIIPKIQGRLVNIARFYFNTATAFVFCVFLISFLLLFWLTFNFHTIESWLNQSPVIWHFEPQILKYEISISISSIWISMSKVSLFLAVVAAIVFRNTAILDENYKNLVFGWWQEKSREWYAASLLYECTLHPYYNLLEARLADKDSTNPNIAIIVIKPDLSFHKILYACERASFMFDINDKRERRVFAYFPADGDEFRPNRLREGWGFIVDPATGHMVLDPLPDLPDAIKQYTHRVSKDDELGIRNRDKGENIPDDWFGEDENGIRLSKKLWALDPGFDIMLHPYVYDTHESKYILIQIKLIRKLADLDLYEKYIDFFYMLARKYFDDKNVAIAINLVDRHTGKSLFFASTDLRTEEMVYQDKIRDVVNTKKIDALTDSMNFTNLFQPHEKSKG